MDTKEVEALQEKIRFYEAVLDNIYNGVMITDPEGKIIFFSKTYGNFLGIDPKEVIGKHCTEVVENTRMHIVSKTGIPRSTILTILWVRIWWSSGFDQMNGEVQRLRPESCLRM
jgi:transcriptional regulator with PAS, ATPase and Fis domain